MDTISDVHALANSQGDGEGRYRGGSTRSRSYGRSIEMNTAPLDLSPSELDGENVNENGNRGYVFGMPPGPGLAQGSGRSLGPGRVSGLGVGPSPVRTQGPANLSFIGNNVFPSPGGM